ncbi:MAG: hypothetical protein LBT40_02350 [Deltaproteobacteria bacterium]|jgi:hypothetical protein|nr:hypothetical protein [Deltaproteobacteria bacterium]
MPHTRSLPPLLLAVAFLLALAAQLLLPAPGLAQDGLRKASRHEEFMADSGYRAAWGIYDDLARIAKGVGWEGLNGRVLKDMKFPEPDAGMEEWERAMKLASLRLGRAIPPELMGSGGEAMKYLRLYMMERERGTPLFGFMRVVAVGSGPEYGVHIAVFRAGFRGFPPGSCEFEGIGGSPRGGVMELSAFEGEGAVSIESSGGVLTVTEAAPVPCQPGTRIGGSSFRTF